jgi:hypothetical protein
VTASLVVTACLLCGCISPAINAEGYRGKVGHSAEKMAGIMGAAMLAAQLDLGGKMLQTASDNVVSDAENDAQSVVTSLSVVQPPDEISIQLRSRAEDVLQNAANELSDLRIALRRDDKAGMRSALAELGKTLADVQHLQESV